MKTLSFAPWPGKIYISLTDFVEGDSSIVDILDVVPIKSTGNYGLIITDSSDPDFYPLFAFLVVEHTDRQPFQVRPGNGRIWIITDFTKWELASEIHSVTVRKWVRSSNRLPRTFSVVDRDSMIKYLSG